MPVRLIAPEDPPPETENSLQQPPETPQNDDGNPSRLGDMIDLYGVEYGDGQHPEPPEVDPEDVELEISKIVKLKTLTPHPLNFRGHPQDQIDHLKASAALHGVYKNITICRDGTILAGHGMVEACRQLGLKSVPVVVKDYDPLEKRALELLAGDNLNEHLAVDDDRAKTELLKLAKEKGSDLFGTGMSDSSLAALIMVSRNASEIEDFDAAAEWVGMPEFEAVDKTLRLVLSFETEEDRKRFAAQENLKIMSSTKLLWSAWWPRKERDDVDSLKFEERGE